MLRGPSFGAVLCATALSACGPILSSAPTDDEAASLGGTAYSLPMQLVRVRLSDVDGALQIQLDQPISVADPAHTYLLSYRPSPLSEDTVDIDIDPKTGLLKQINLTAADKTDDIIVEIARSAALVFEATTAAEGRQIFTRLLDPSDEVATQELVDDMNRVAIADAAIRQESACRAPSDERARTICASYRSVAAGRRRIDVTITKPPPYPAPVADCSIGVCYRHAMPYRFRVEFDGTGYSVEEAHSLTNAMPAIPIDLARASFVTKVSTIDFDAGQLDKVHVEKPSEGLELASLPIRVMRAFFGAVAELIQLRVNVGTQEQLLAQRELDVLRAEQALEDAKRQQMVTESAAQAYTALLIARSDGGHPKRALPGFDEAMDDARAITPPPAEGGAGTERSVPSHPGTGSPEPDAGGGVVE